MAAPYGYVINRNYVTVAVDTNTFYEIDADTNDAIITVAYENEPTVGKLTVKKTGEVLDAFKGRWFAKSENKEFVYVESSLAGAKFEVYANEDIYTADIAMAAGNSAPQPNVEKNVRVFTTGGTKQYERLVSTELKKWLHHTDM